MKPQGDYTGFVNGLPFRCRQWLRPLRRTALAILLLLVPAVIWDRDGRGLHDRLTETAVVRD